LLIIVLPCSRARLLLSPPASCHASLTHRFNVRHASAEHTPGSGAGHVRRERHGARRSRGPPDDAGAERPAASVAPDLPVLRLGVFWSGWNALRGAREALGPKRSGSFRRNGIVLPVTRPVRDLNLRRPASESRSLASADIGATGIAPDLPTRAPACRSDLGLVSGSVPGGHHRNPPPRVH